MKLKAAKTKLNEETVEDLYPTNKNAWTVKYTRGDIAAYNILIIVCIIVPVFLIIAIICHFINRIYFPKKK